MSILVAPRFLSGHFVLGIVPFPGTKQPGSIIRLARKLPRNPTRPRDARQESFVPRKPCPGFRELPALVVPGSESAFKLTRSHSTPLRPPHWQRLCYTGGITLGQKNFAGFLRYGTAGTQSLPQSNGKRSRKDWQGPPGLPTWPPKTPASPWPFAGSWRPQGSVAACAGPGRCAGATGCGS